MRSNQSYSSVTQSFHWISFPGCLVISMKVIQNPVAWRIYIVNFHPDLVVSMSQNSPVVLKSLHLNHLMKQIIIMRNNLRSSSRTQIYQIMQFHFSITELTESQVYSVNSTLNLLMCLVISLRINQPSQPVTSTWELILPECHFVSTKSN